MIKQIKKTQDKLMVETDINVSLANAIRRSVNEIPILAVDEIDIYRNDSALYDEIIAHRIGLIPIKQEKLTEIDKCSCKGKGCSKCTIEFKLNVEGREVLSQDLGKESVFEDMPIVLLEGEQGLEIVAKARLGRGKDHAKFSPGIIFYKEGVKIIINKDAEKNEEITRAFPAFFEFEEKLEAKNEYECDLDSLDFKDYKGIELKPTGNIIFNIESWGQIKPEEIFLEAIKALEKNLSELSKSLD
jgi:DNA-directed RNA polymerase subunit D